MVWIVIGCLLKVQLVRIKWHIVSFRVFFFFFNLNHQHYVCKQMNTVHSQLRFRILWDNDHKNNSNCNCVCICVHMLTCMLGCVFMHTWHGGQWTSLWSCFPLSTMYGFWGVWESRWFLYHGKEIDNKNTFS